MPHQKSLFAFGVVGPESPPPPGKVASQSASDDPIRFCIRCKAWTPFAVRSIVNGRQQYGCRPCDRAKRIRTRRKFRLAIIAHYGPSCACCGESTYEFLALDHINGGGNKHRKAIVRSERSGGTEFYQWVIRNNFPTGFRILCHNCNFARGAYGRCPHEKTQVSNT